MTIEQLKALVIEELDSRELKSRARYSALDKIIPFIKKQYGVDVAIVLFSFQFWTPCLASKILPSVLIVNQGPFGLLNS